MEKHVDSAGVRIAYDDRGEPSRLSFVCLPGWGVNRGFFDALAERLAARHRVLSLDWRGHGGSEHVGGEYGHDALTDDALAVVEASGASAIVPIAQAHAGWVAIELRRRLGDRVPAIVASSWLVMDPPPQFLGVLEALQSLERNEDARERLFQMWTHGAPAHVAERVRREMGAYGFDLWARAARAIAGEYARHGEPIRLMAAMASPPPFLHIVSSPVHPELLAAQERFARESNWFKVTRLEQTVSHFPMLEAPEAMAAEIERFALR
jgi:pimeloyl-ACP methyl ester carboxylesterase